MQETWALILRVPREEAVRHQESGHTRDDQRGENGADGTASGFYGRPGVSTPSLAESEMIRSEYVIPTLLNNKDYVRSFPTVRFPKEVQRPGTVKWVARRLDDNSPEMARAKLANWVHPSRKREATEENVHRIRKLLDKVAVGALLELAEPRKYVWGRTDGRQLDLELTLGTLDDKRSFRVEALLDSGCTGSCIDRTFIKENGITTETLPIPVMSTTQTAPQIQQELSQRGSGSMSRFGVTLRSWNLR